MGKGTVISQPKVSSFKLPQSTEVSNEPQKVLLIGQSLSGGSVVPGATGKLVTDIGNAGEEDALFGARSMLAEMVRAFRDVNKETRLDVIALADAGAAVQAETVITFTDGPASAASTFIVYVGAKRYAFSVAVAVDDTITEIGDALVAAITANTDAPFTAANAAGVVTITAENGGTVGNDMGITFSGTITGVTVALTAASSGATDPVLTGLEDLIGDERYQTIVHPIEYGISTLKTFMDDRWNVADDILDGVIIVTSSDTLANQKTALNALNSQSVVYICDKVESIADEYEGSAMFDLNYVKSCVVAAIRSLRLTEGSNLTRIIVQKDAPLDNIGGTYMASFPYFNTPLYYLPIVDIDKGWTKLEIEELFDVGGSVLGTNKTRTNVLAGEFVTTYKTDAASNPDLTWRFLNSVDTASNAAEYLFNNFKADFAQSRLTNGALARGHAIANEDKLRASMLKYYDRLSSEDFLLLEAGAVARAAFDEKLNIVIDLLNGRATITDDANMVAQLREIIVLSSFGFSEQE